MSADCIGTGCAKESLLARVRELDLQMRGLMLDRQVERGLRERAEAERDDYVRYASKFAEERDALQNELRGCTQNFDDACTTLAKVEADLLTLQSRYERVLIAGAEARERAERAEATLNDHLESEAAETMRADRERLRAERAEAELATERALFREFQVKGIPMKYKRMEFNARLQKENADLRAERDALWALLSEHRDFPNAGDAEAFRQWHKDWCARRDAALGEKP